MLHHIAEISNLSFHALPRLRGRLPPIISHLNRIKVKVRLLFGGNYIPSTNWTWPWWPGVVEGLRPRPSASPGQHQIPVTALCPVTRVAIGEDSRAEERNWIFLLVTSSGKHFFFFLNYTILGVLYLFINGCVGSSFLCEGFL